MMAVRVVFSLFCESWNLYRKYILTELNEDELDSFTEEADKIFKKYDQTPMAKDLILAVINEIERKEKKRKDADRKDDK